MPGDFDVLGELPEGFVAFDVTETGDIININISGPEAVLEQDNVGAIAIRLEQSVYRPKIENGRPVSSRATVSAAEL